jgi:hypothetical protein
MRLAGGGALTLVPDRAMLLAPSQNFPVYIDPTWQPASSPASHFDMVQATAPCNTVPYYDNENPDGNPDSLGVGYYPASWGTCYGTQDAYYTMPVPPTVDGAVINLATFNAAEDYSASCAADHDVNLILTGAIGKNTDYANPPAWYSSTLSVTQNGLGVPDTAGNDVNCNGTFTTSQYSEPYGFTITSAVKTAAKTPYESALTFVLTESSQDSTGDSFKRFTNNPTLQIQYDFPPAQPVGLEVGDNSSSMLSCPTSSPLPQLGASTGSGVQLTAGYSQKDAEALTAYFEYWDVTAGQTETTNAKLSTAVGGSSTTKVSNPVTIPQTAINKMSDNDTVDVKTWSVDPASQQSNYSTCSFKVYPTAPGGTSVTMTSAANPPMGSQATFKLAATTPKSCTVSSFEWALDKTPVTGAQTSAPASGSVTITIPSPGSHELFAYANCSNNINPTDTGSTKFTAAGDLALTCANWSAAMSNKCTDSTGNVNSSEPFDNTMLSGGDTSCPATGGDGGGRNYVATELANQGWKSNGQVMVDGAQFALPSFGSCQTDNVLAANQTIDMSGQGSALVFLATSTSALAKADVGTGTPGSIWGSDATVPPVAANVGVTGTGCTDLTAFSGTTTGCQPATGQIYYTDGSHVTYYLSVPDWVTGPTDIAAVGINDRTNAAGTIQASKPKIYAFAVPINPALAVAKVILPDVNDTVSATGLSYTMQALHIFGMSVRSNVAATPLADGNSATIPTSCGCAWTGAYESPIETAWAPSSGNYGNQTIRLAVSVNVSAPAGAELRIHLANPGFLWGDGDGPITIAAATAAAQASGATPAQAPQALSFGQGTPPPSSATLCAGCDVYSNPFSFPYAIAAGQSLLVSLYVSNNTLGYLPGSQSPSGALEWITAGNHASDTDGTAFTTSSPMDSLLTGVDITTVPPAGGTLQGVPVQSQPTVVVAGNNVIDQGGSNAFVVPDNGAPSIRIAGDLANVIPVGQGNPVASGYGVVDAGIENNLIQADASGVGGVSLLARLDRDILQEPDVGSVIIDAGLEDLLQGASSDSVTAAMGQMYTILGAWGITTTLSTLTPCASYVGSGSPPDACPSGGTVDSARQVVNPWIANQALPIPVAGGIGDADMDSMVSIGGGTDQLQAAYENNDYVNLTVAGYKQAASAISPSDLYPNVFP